MQQHGAPFWQRGVEFVFFLAVEFFNRYVDRACKVLPVELSFRRHVNNDEIFLRLHVFERSLWRQRAESAYCGFSAYVGTACAAMAAAISKITAMLFIEKSSSHYFFAFFGPFSPGCQ